MDRDLLRLGLVNHALAHGVGYDKAWPMVDRVMADAGNLDVRALADRVRLAAVDIAGF